MKNESRSVVSDSFVNPCAIALQAPLSIGFSRQEYWSGLLFPSPGHLPNPGIEPSSPASQADSLPPERPGSSCYFFESQSESCLVVSHSFQPIQFHGLYSPWNSLGQNTGVDSLSLLQGIFPTQGSNPGLPHCRQILYQLRYKRSPSYLFSPLIF